MLYVFPKISSTYLFIFISPLQAKIALLKKACKEKDELIDKLSEEIRDLRHAIATSTLDDMSKIRTFGYSPENFGKLAAQREQEQKIAKREPEVCVRFNALDMVF